MAVDYSLPPWLQFDPAQRLNQAIQTGRAQTDREQEQGFNEGIESDQDQRAQQTSEMQQMDAKQRAQIAAAHLADLTAYQNDINSGVDPKMAILKHPSVFSGRLPASLFTPSKPAAPASPLAIPAPTDQWGGTVPNAYGEPNVAPPGANDVMQQFQKAYAAPAPAAAPKKLWTEETLDGVPGQRNTTTGQFRPFPKKDTRPDAALQKDATYKKLLDARDVALLAARDAEKPDDIVDKGQAFQKANQAVVDYAKARGITVPKFDAFPEDKKEPAADGKHFPKGTKVQNSEGKVKWLHTDGSIPEGWTLAQ